MALTISGLSKTYSNGVKALQNLFADHRKHMFGLLGPNGAGKSTLMRTIATLQDPIEAASISMGSTFSRTRKKFAKSSAIFHRNLAYIPKSPPTDMLHHLAS